MGEKEQEVEIIRLLKAGAGYTSGQSLSASLGVSRTAVWKHIEALRKMGYAIEASPSKGYRLLEARPFNGVELQTLLSGKLFGREVHFFDSIDSTNAKAFELAREGAPEGTIVVAETQTRGKGRIGRKWESPAGMNLYLSVILRPKVAPQGAQGLTFVAAVAAAEAVSASGVKPAVKWPNDILIGGRKTAGILLEMDSEPDRVHFVVAGIGVNLNARRDMFPEYIKDTATSLFEETGSSIDRGLFTARLLSSMERWYGVYLSEGFVPVLEAWKGSFRTVGKPVKVTFFDRTIEGICAGVDSDGALLLEREGRLERIISGDVEAL
ncbi:BirA family transcriptional regulator, biotin operon repressor / biotin---[acetyl-CoA-carboxylase] ligase [uncultured bacterium]|nr:BirA family transcriptional regulator, biotin operon repressor / biotin---[acetyl-CoA-carboxylase] ligase [uncultured bacterium]